MKKKFFDIPILDLFREYLFLEKNIQKQLNDCFNSHQWVLGPKVEEFERKVAKYLKSRFAIGVASGTDALLLSLRALAIRLKKKEFFDEKDEIITTPFTFVATAEAILRSGAKPVFVDIDSDTFNINPKEVKKAITKNTVGILPVHLYGLPCDIGQILKIAKEHNLFVVEDSAQALGAAYKGRKAGTFGDLGAFSFFPSKNLGAYGDGGLIATKNKRLAELIKTLRNHGQLKKYNASYIGYNSRLDSIQAAVLLAKLKYIEKFNNLRRKIAKKYTAGLRGLKEIQLPFFQSEYKHIYHLYTIKVLSKRDELLNFLNSQGVGARIYYPLPLYKMKAFKIAKCKKDLKVTEGICSKVISLPISPFLKEDEVNYIISTIKKFYKR